MALEGREEGQEGVREVVGRSGGCAERQGRGVGAREVEVRYHLGAWEGC